MTKQFYVTLTYKTLAADAAEAVANARNAVGQGAGVYTEVRSGDSCPLAREGEGDISEVLGKAAPDALETAARTALALIGNVDHSKGHGANAAKLRGDLLNDIRDIFTRALSNKES